MSREVINVADSPLGLETHEIVALGGVPTSAEVSDFVAAVGHMQHVADVPSLAIDKFRTNPEIPRPLIRPYGVSLAGWFVYGEERVGEEFRVWISFTDYTERGDDLRPKLQVNELYAGVVRKDGSPGTVYDITRDSLPASGLRRAGVIPGFPVQWRQLVAAQAMAVSLSGL